jgi:hypothetical protein
LEGKTNKLDLTGERIYEFSLKSVKLKIYQENIENIVSIYPNPTKVGEKTKIQMNPQLSISDLHIFDVNGVEVNVPITNSNNKIEIEHLNKGVYFLIFNSYI